MGLFDSLKKVKEDGMVLARAKEVEKGAEAREKEFNERAKAYKEEGILFCPKCLARNLKTNKKKYKISSNGDEYLLINSNGEAIGSIYDKNIELICPCCGHQWKAIR